MPKINLAGFYQKEKQEGRSKMKAIHPADTAIGRASCSLCIT
jgi:hypothetical protein